MSDVNAEDYARGLLGEEASEIGVALGKAQRFGLDTPGPETPPYLGMTARQMVELECGDMLAAIEWAIRAGLIHGGAVNDRKRWKLAKLLNPESRDNLGRRLAPHLDAI